MKRFFLYCLFISSQCFGLPFNKKAFLQEVEPMDYTVTTGVIASENISSEEPRRDYSYLLNSKEYKDYLLSRGFSGVVRSSPKLSIAAVFVIAGGFGFYIGKRV